MWRSRIAFISLGLLLVLSTPPGTLGQAETGALEGGIEVEPTAVPEPATTDAAAGNAGVDEAVDPALVIEPPANVPAMESESVVIVPEQTLTEPEPSIIDPASGGAVAVGDAVNPALSVEPSVDAPAMGDERVVEAPVGAVSEPEGEGPELAPPEEQPSGLPASVAAPESQPVQGVAPASAPAAPAQGTSAAVNAPAAPTRGQRAVIARGLVEIAPDEVVWRAVRYLSDAPEDVAPASRPPGFVVALDDPLLLVDEASSARLLLRPGEAAFVPGGASQQRASQSGTPVPYLAIELVPASSAEDAVNGDVAFVSEPFSPSARHRLLVLARHELPVGRVLTVPDTGERNLLMVIEGAVVAQATAGSGAPTLSAGDNMVFRGAWEIAAAGLEESAGSSQERATILIASMGAP